MKKLSVAFLMAGALLHADSILPASYSTILAVGESATISKTVTISQQLTAPLDLFFLTDTTGSMGSAIFNVRSGFSSVVSAVDAVATDAHYGAGQYKDIFDSLIYRTDIDLTGDSAAVQSAMSSWSASGGGDTPEANLYALEQVATTASWRPDSVRILVWTGDAPGHDPRNGSTEASAIAALQAAGVQVFSVGATSGPGIDQTGQATRISNATGGSFLGSLNPTSITEAITKAISDSISEYSVVELDVVGLNPGLEVMWVPSSYSGSYDRSEERKFGFDVTFKGTKAGTYNFQVVAKVDGRIVAREDDRIVVGDATVPEPSTYLLMGAGLVSLSLLRRRVKAQA